MKRTLVVLSVGAVLVVGGALVVPGFIDWNQYKEQIEGQAKRFTGYTVRIGGDIGMAVLPFPHVSLNDLSVMPPDVDKPLLTLDRADVRIALGPLLGGKISFSSVRLDRPVLALAVDAQGRKNWMTPELEALTGQKGGKAENAEEAPQAAAEAPPSGIAVSIDSVRVTDGAFRFTDLQSGTEMDVGDINVSLSADDLRSGPYKLEGDLAYQGREVHLEASTSRIDNPESVAVQLEAALDEPKAALRYSGILAVGETPEVQGEMGLEIADAGAALTAFGGDGTPLAGQKFAAQGILTASQQAAAYKNLRLTLGKAVLGGDAEVSGLQQKPMTFKAVLTADAPVDLDALVPGGGEQGTAGEAQGFLPEAITLPGDMTGSLSLTAPELIYRGQHMKSVDFLLEKKTQAIDINVSVGDLPGGGRTDINSTLSFGAQSSGGESGGVVYSEPRLSVKGGFSVERIHELASAFLPQQKLPEVLRAFDTVDADLNVIVRPRAIEVAESTVRLDRSVFAVKGGYQIPLQGGRPQASASVAADRLDLDKLIPVADRDAVAPDTKETPLKAAVASLQKLSLPLDVSFDLGAQSLNYKGTDVHDVRLRGALTGNSLKIEGASVGDLYGGRMDLSGAVQDLQKLSGLDLNVSAQARDVEALLKAMSIEAKGLPRPFGAAEIAADVKGDADALSFKAMLKALRGEVNASGTLSGLLDEPQVGNLVFQAKHPNFSDAMRIFKPDMPRNPSLEKPVDIYASVDRKGEAYVLDGIKANLGPVTAQGDLTVDASGKRPSVVGKIRTGALPLGDLMGVSKTGNTAAAQGGEPRWSRNAINTDWMRAVDANLDFAATSLTYGQWVLSDPAMKLALSDGTLTVSDLQAKLYGGTLAASGALESPENPREPLSLKATTKFQGVQISSMVKAMTGALPLRAEGDIGMDLDIQTSGISPAALVLDLGGTGSLAGQNVVLQGVDFRRFAEAMSSGTKPGDTVTGLWKSATSGGRTAFDTVDGAFTIEEGVATFTKMVMDGPEGSVSTAGNINLPRWTVDLKNTVTLKPAEGQSEAPPPFDIVLQGPLDNPGQTFGQGLMQDYFQRKLNRKLEGLIGDKLKLPGLQQQQQEQPSQGGTPQPPSQDSGEVKPEKVIGDVLQGLIGGQ